MSTKTAEMTTTPFAVAQPAVVMSMSKPPGGVVYQPLPVLGRFSNNYQCQFCQQTGPTHVKEKIGTCAIISLVVLLICFWPLFWLPLVMPSCKDKDHICGYCQRKVSCTWFAISPHCCCGQNNQHNE
jgi:hypothetical protein